MQRNLYVFRNLQLPVQVPLLPFGKLNNGTLIKPKSTVNSLTYDVETGLSKDVKLTKVSFLQAGCIIAAHSTITISEVTFNTLTSKLDDEYFFDMTNESKITANPEHFHDLVDKYNKVQDDKESLAKEIADLTGSIEELKQAFLESKEFYQQRIGELQEKNTSLILENEAESHEIERLNDTLLEEERTMLLETERFKSELVEKVSLLDKLTSQIVGLEKTFDSVASSHKDSAYKVVKLKELFSKFVDSTEIPELKSIKSNLVDLIERAHEDVENSKRVISDLAATKDNEIAELKDKVENEKSDKEVLSDIISQLVTKAKMSDNISELEIQSKISALRERDARITSLLNTLNERNEENSNLRKIIVAHNEEIESLCDKNSSILIDFNMATSENNDLKDRIFELEVANRKYECEIQLLNNTVSKVCITFNEDAVLSSKVEMVVNSFDILGKINSDLESQIQELEERNRDLLADNAKLACEIEMLNRNASKSIVSSGDELNAVRVELAVLNENYQRASELNNSYVEENRYLLEKLTKLECEIELLNKSGCHCDEGCTCKKLISIEDFDVNNLKDKLTVTEQICEELILKYEESTNTADTLRSELDDKTREFSEVESRLKSDILVAEKRIADLKELLENSKHDNFQEVKLLTERTELVRLLTESLCELKNENQLLSESKHNTDSELTHEREHIASLEKIITECSHLIDGVLGSHNYVDLYSRVVSLCSKFESHKQTAKMYATRIESDSAEINKMKELEKKHSTKIKAAMDEIESLKEKLDKHSIVDHKDHDKLEEKIASLEVENESLSIDKNTLSSRISSLETDLAIANSKINDYDERFETLSRQIDEKVSSLERLIKIDEELQKQNVIIKTQNDSLVAQLEKKNADYAALHHKNDLLVASYTELKLLYSKLQEERSGATIEGDLTENNQNEINIDVNETLMSKNFEIANLRVEIAKLKEELSKCEQEYNQTVIETNTFASQNKELKSYVIQLSDIIQTANGQFVEQKDKIGDLQEKLKVSSEEKENLQVQIDEYKVCIGELCDKVTTLSEEKMEFEKKLSTQQTPQIESIAVGEPNPASQNEAMEMLDLIENQLRAMKQLESELVEEKREHLLCEERLSLTLDALFKIEEKYESSRKEIERLECDMKGKCTANENEMSEIVNLQYLAVAKLTSELDDERKLNSHYKKQNNDLVEELKVVTEAYIELEDKMNIQSLELIDLKEKYASIKPFVEEPTNEPCSVADPECNTSVTQCNCSNYSREIEFMKDKISGLEDYCNSYKAKMQKLADMKISEGIASRMMTAINAEILASEKHIEMLRKRSEKKPVDLATFKVEASSLIEKKNKMIAEIRDLLESVEILIRM